MAQSDEKWTSLPRFPDTPGEAYRSWRKRILWQLNSIPDEKIKLFAPRIIAECLPDSVHEILTEVDPAEFRSANGTQRLLQLLDDQFSAFPEIELAECCATFFSSHIPCGE